MVTDPEQSTTVTDDRSYLYPHAFPPPAELRPLPQLVPGEPSQPGPAPLGPDRSDAPERAVIGNALRIPQVWCEFGSCIARFADAAALGESDVRSGAIAAGWRHDALGRLACPGCVQHDPTFRVSYPLAERAVVRHGADRAASEPHSAYQAEVSEPHSAYQAEVSEPHSAYQAGVSEPPAADYPPPAAGASGWDGPPPRLNLAAPIEPEPVKPAWWRHRHAGRHR